MSCRTLNELARLYEESKKLGLNTNLMMEQSLTTDEIRNIIKLHKRLNEIFDEENKIIENKEISEIDKKHLMKLSQEVKEIEFNLQKNWHFDQDEKYHTWWYKQPACSCPKLDNADRFGYEYKIYSSDCILHGGEK